MAKISRNDPCPCGSGKKYKKCCLLKESGQKLSQPNEFDILMADGYKALEEQQSKKACDVWLQLWDKLKEKKDPACKNINDMEKIFSQGEHVFNWCQDLELEMGNAGSTDPDYHKKRVEFCKEFCSLFPETDSLILFNMKRAIAEAYFATGDSDSGDKQFDALIKEYPRNIWGYIGWGDMYFRPEHESIKPDFDKAENLYQMALKKEKKDTGDKKNIMEKSIVEERLEELHKERMKKT